MNKNVAIRGIDCCSANSQDRYILQIRGIPSYFIVFFIKKLEDEFFPKDIHFFLKLGHSLSFQTFFVFSKRLYVWVLEETKEVLLVMNTFFWFFVFTFSLMQRGTLDHEYYFWVFFFSFLLIHSFRMVSWLFLNDFEGAFATFKLLKGSNTCRVCLFASYFRVFKSFGLRVVRGTWAKSCIYITFQTLPTHDVSHPSFAGALGKNDTPTSNYKFQ